MTPSSPLNSKVVETLSEYLDGRLSEPNTSALKKKLAQEPELRAYLKDLAAVRSLLRSMPELRSPRNLTIPAEQAIRKPTWTFPMLAYGIGSASAALLSIFLFAGPVFSTSLPAGSAAQPAMVESPLLSAPNVLTSVDQASPLSPAPPSATPEETTPQQKSFAALGPQPTPSENAVGASLCTECPSSDGQSASPEAATPESPIPDLATPSLTEYLPMAERSTAEQSADLQASGEISPWTASAIASAGIALGLGILFVRSRKRQ
jgi:hypothetical protein